jgi:hypothetical protein
LTFELRIFEREHGRDHYARGHHAWSHLRFAVVDLNKSEDYPGNFVSILPTKIDTEGKIASVFTKFFGKKSIETARRLLTKSLKKKHNPQITAELERRLNLLEPNPVVHVKCRVCKKFFKTHKERAHKPKICPECMKRFDRQEK